MSPPRRIPPIHCLQAFEALARLRSVTLAADELHVTPSAISHRIRQLETLLGLRLFGREFQLTTPGASYLVRVREALDALQHLPGGAAPVAPGRIRLRVAVTPTFSRQVLLPRLSLFRQAWPDIDLELQVAIPLLDTLGEDADLEVRYGTGPYPGFEAIRIMSDRVSPVASAAYLAESGPFEDFETEGAIARARLIRSPLEPWRTWFSACGLNLREPADGAQFNDVGLMLDAAVAGFGVALMRLRLGAAWLDSGQLVRLSQRSVPAPYHHFLVWKPGMLARWECAAFVDWLRGHLPPDPPEGL